MSEERNVFAAMKLATVLCVNGIPTKINRDDGCVGYVPIYGTAEDAKKAWPDATIAKFTTGKPEDQP